MPETKTNETKTDIRVIKKYPNRRLYDTGASRYITLEDIKKMAIGNEPFCVRDAKTGEDITRAALLQALLSEESFEQPVLSEQGLRNLIAFFHGPFRGPMSVYLEQCMPVFLETQQKMQDKFGGVLSATEMEQMATVQGIMARQMLEKHIFGGVENFFNAQKQMHEGVRQMMNGGGMFPMPNTADFFRPPEGKKDE
ncbi:MAG: polyhydroxyalkanoate synthesis repressor PhaR [Gammaproteobacteria bacterium WSBS_2016_MAG_OTU1]